ncbi:MAG: hypothetical protein AAF639_09945 [Chloroflexota bacterium]
MPEYLDWFVDRAKQYDGYLQMVDRQTAKQIMQIEAPENMGKTWLLMNKRHASQRRSIPVAMFDFRDRRPWDYLTLVRQARDQLGPAAFNKLTAEINKSTNVNLQINADPSSSESSSVDINLATEGGEIQESSIEVGDVAGRDIVKDNFFYIQADSPTARRAIEIRITDAFFSCLDHLSAEQVVAFLFDSYENVTTEADRWLQTQFLTRIRDGLLPNVVVVMAGREVPRFDRAWRSYVARTGLEPFDMRYVREYIRERRGLTQLDVDTVLLTSGGSPGLLAQMADIAAIQLDDFDDDWL